MNNTGYTPVKLNLPLSSIQEVRPNRVTPRNEEKMTDWKSLLNDDATHWLLEESNPSIRYFTLRWLLDKSESDPEVVAASQMIAQSSPIQKILKRQRPAGYWGSDSRAHHGTTGYMILFMWLGYRGNGAVSKAMDYRINGCLLDDGAYGIELKGRTFLAPCHGADLLRQMLWYGYLDDPRTRALLEWLLRIQNVEGAWPCVSKVKPFSCLWATAVVLRAYRDLPSDWLTVKVVESRHRAIDLFLNSNLYQQKQSKTSPRWFQFGFPLRFDTDILEVLELVAPFVTPEDERIQEGISLVMEKQDEKGRWPCEKHPNGGMWINKFVALEEIGKPSKWVTLHALKMLKTLHSEEK
jgi:hypothetical protein